MTTTPHTTLLEMLSRPVTGDAGGVLKNEIEAVFLASEKTHDITTPISVETESEKTTPEDIRAGELIYHEALAYIKDAIAPAMIKISPHDIQVNDTFCKTLFTYAYPDFLE
jgi:hypothetical protein